MALVGSEWVISRSGEERGGEEERRLTAVLITGSAGCMTGAFGAPPAVAGLSAIALP